MISCNVLPVAMFQMDVLFLSFGNFVYLCWQLVEKTWVYFNFYVVAFNCCKLWCFLFSISYIRCLPLVEDCKLVEEHHTREHKVADYIRVRPADVCKVHSPRRLGEAVR